MARAAISGSRILKTMIVDGALTRAALCKQLGLSKAAVTILVNKLLRRKLIFEGEVLNENRVGRKTTALSVQSDLVYFVGTDMESLAIRTCILDAAGNRVYSDKRAIESSASKSAIFRQWAKLIGDTIRHSGIRSEKIAGVGVGLPGVVDREKLSTRAYLPPGQWVDFDVSGLLSKLGLDMTVANNVVCVSEYERKKGKAAGLSYFISLLLRYGIGACIYSNGELTIGQELGTGELGHMRIDLRGPRCICGQRGCLDVYASGRTLTEKVKRADRIDLREIKSRARYVGIGIANMLKLFHPPSILINGIYNDYQEAIKPVIEQTLSEELAGLKLPIPEVLFGEPVELKTSEGAAMKAADEFAEAFLERTYF
jgi:predicted NBD/HSP70 family sugar kinase